jgi:glyoxylase-like metal-dependent hydrolase (beta-lactamase superfamily II)
MQWNVGRVKITRAVEMETVGSTRFILPLATHEEIQKLPWLIPDFATAEGRLKMSIHSLLVETPSRRIIVDTGLGNDKQGRNVPTWNNRNEPFLDRLTAAGFPPDSIDTVLCTHLHVDHVGWNTRLEGGKWVPTFANARYVFGKTEFDYWTEQNAKAEVPPFADSVLPVVEAKRADIVGKDYQIGDHVRVLPTPGHTPGHIAFTFGRGKDDAAFSGDLMHSPLQTRYPELSAKFDVDQRQAAETRRNFLDRYCDTETLCCTAHFPSPSTGRIRRLGNGFSCEAVAR